MRGSGVNAASLATGSNDASKAGTQNQPPRLQAFPSRQAAGGSQMEMADTASFTASRNAKRVAAKTREKNCSLQQGC